MSSPAALGGGLPGDCPVDGGACDDNAPGEAEGGRENEVTEVRP